MLSGPDGQYQVWLVGPIQYVGPADETPIGGRGKSVCSPNPIHPPKEDGELPDPKPNIQARWVGAEQPQCGHMGGGGRVDRIQMCRGGIDATAPIQTQGGGPGSSPGLSGHVGGEAQGRPILPTRGCSHMPEVIVWRQSTHKQGGHHIVQFSATPPSVDTNPTPLRPLFFSSKHLDARAVTTEDSPPSSMDTKPDAFTSAFFLLKREEAHC